MNADDKYDKPVGSAAAPHKGDGAPQFAVASPFGEISGTALFIAMMAVIVIGLSIAAIFMHRHFNEQTSPSDESMAATGALPASASVSTAATGNASAPQVTGQTMPLAQSMPAAAKNGKQRFSAPSEASVPGGDYGKVIQLGENVFMDTKKYAGKYVGNDLSCANCHLDAGRKPGSAPMWAAFIHYPAFRSKTGKVDTLASRIQGCFQFSMNGTAPQQDDEIMTALQTYAFWLATGAPVATAVDGSGYPKLKPPPLPASYERGEKVYTQNCALCHGADGAGQRAGDQQVFPPLWGARSFNWGAGMHQLANAAGFIKANMPLGKGGSLSDQDAWDAAVFMNSHERPQDPRFTKSVAETRKKYHDTDDSLYGTTVAGHVLGSK